MGLDALKKWLPGVLATTLTAVLLYLAIGLPCVSGAGAALSGLLEYILLVLVAVPCLLWAGARLIFGQHKREKASRGGVGVDRLAKLTIAGVVAYALLVIPTLFFYPHPLQFFCG